METLRFSYNLKSAFHNEKNEGNITEEQFIF